MRRTFSIPALGIGKPDYSEEIASGRIKAGIRLAYNEQLKMFVVMFTPLPSPVPWRRDPLPIGDMQHLIDSATGIPTPYAYQAGYDLEILSWWYSLSQNLDGVTLGDGMPVLTNALLARDNFYIQEIVGWSGTYLDPEFGQPHLVDFMATNVGVAPCTGSMMVLAILRRIRSTPLSTTKKVRCPYCKAEKTVPLMSTKIKCDKCGKPFWVYAFGWGGRIPSKR